MVGDNPFQLHKKVREDLLCVPIVVYRYKSRGEILGEFESYKQLIELELKCDKSARKENTWHKVYMCLSGKSKSYFSFHFQARAVVKRAK